MTLTYYNGTETKPGFKWLRITSSSMSYLTEKTFGGKRSYSVDVSGELASGGNQMIVEAGGVAGSTFGWRLTTPAPHVTAVEPNTVAAGGTVTVTGANLCSDPSGNVATLGQTPLTCVAATSTSAVFKIPETSSVGSSVFNLKVAGLEAGHAELSVGNSVPVLKSVSAPWVAPGYNLTIYGGPFSPAVANDKVTIGPFQAEIREAGVNQITVIAPASFAGNPWGVHQPVKVWVNGVRARNVLTVNCYEGISF